MPSALFLGMLVFALNLAIGYAQDPPAEQKPAEQKSTEQKPAEQKPAEQKPTEGKSRIKGATAPAPAQPDNLKIALEWLASIAKQIDEYQDKIVALRWNNPPEQNQKEIDDIENLLEEEYRRLLNSSERKANVPADFKDVLQRSRFNTEEQYVISRLAFTRLILLDAKTKLAFSEKYVDITGRLQKMEADIAKLKNNLILWFALIVFAVVALGFGVWLNGRSLKLRISEIRQTITQQPEGFYQRSTKAFSHERAKLVDEIDKRLRKPDDKKSLPPSPPPLPEPRAIEQFVTVYNTAVRDDSRYGDFWDYYGNALTTIGITNSEQRIDDEKILPIFGEASNGELWVVEIKENQGTTYAVVPKIGSLYSERKFRRASLGYVFYCNERGEEGQKITVKKAAIFETDAQRSMWHLKNKGEISLG